MREDKLVKYCVLDVISTAIYHKKMHIQKLKMMLANANDELKQLEQEFIEERDK